MEAAYEADLANATEIVLSAHNRVRPAIGSTGTTTHRAQRTRRPRGRLGGSASRAAAGALRIGNAVGAAMSNQRVLGPAETGIMVSVAVTILVLVTLGIMWPLAVVLPLSAVGLWIALSLLVRAVLLRRHGERDDEPTDQLK